MTQPRSRIRTTWQNIVKLAKSSSAFGQRPLLTLINDSLSSKFRSIFLSSSRVCVQRGEENTDQDVFKISCQKISVTRKSPEGWPLTFWPNVQHIAPSFRLPLEYEVRSVYIENIHSNCTWNNGLFVRHNDLDLQTGDLKLYVCLPVVLYYQAENVLLNHNQKYGIIIGIILEMVLHVYRK